MLDKDFPLSKYVNIQSVINERILFITERYSGGNNAFYVQTLFYITQKLQDTALIAYDLKKIDYSLVKNQIDMYLSELAKVEMDLKKLGRLDSSFSVNEYERNYSNQSNHLKIVS